MSETIPNLAAMAAAAAEAIKQEEELPKLLWKPENYYNQDGARIEHRVIISGKKPEGFATFLAHGAIEVEIPIGRDKNGKLVTQPQRRPIVAKIDAYTPEEASGKAKAALSIEAEKFRKEFEEAKTAALKKAQEDVASKNTRKLITEGLPAEIK
jgi:hypothetical protein